MNIAAVRITYKLFPTTQDDRTYHEALPVTKGVKYAANFWLHMHDYRGPNERGCTPEYVDDDHGAAQS